MHYFVHRKTGGKWQEIAKTRYLEDAQLIMKRWAVSYIMHEGEIIERRGWTTA